ncbi:DUF881 domain-containing protein [Isachenkonia alkalipeptolytica]|uniref:DUF881 domain-containing protein n=1 Tax=Isachenkonia alkalipeptolytica TaxID=2565777 RepID=A0AA43XKJ8_9CLOT|nr:DUF881 domain-containing protein [Isachenkonia alkalipeptolytica]NBG88523.1 DUF881 domain-containing protein [Isachenkonia alkalipeptolytica]
MKNSRDKLIIGITFFFVSFMLVTNIRNTDMNYDFIRLDTVEAFNTEISETKQEVEDLEEYIEQQRIQLKEYQQALQEGTLEEVLAIEVKKQKMYSHLTPLRGPGVTVTLEDSERELDEGEDPNNLVIHDLDVLNILNDLRRAGAEALAINGQRVTSQTQIKCQGATITVNDVTYGQPFIIEAIGNPDTLNAAINAPTSYAYILREYYELPVGSEISDEILIKAFEREPALNYIEIQEGD